MHSIAEGALSLEHSFDGQNFKLVAPLKLPETGEAPLADYSEILATDASKLLASAKSDGLYYIRISNGVVASIPARCWAVAGSDAQLVVHALGTGAVVAASLSAPCGANIASPSDATQIILPRIDSVQVVRPVPAPTVTLPAAAPSAALQQASNSAKGQVSQREGKKEELDKPDERTWIQKNWLPLTLVGFMLLNRMGQAGQEYAGGPPPPPGARALPAGASRPAGK
ncbi:hypothetical protein Ndes2526B_g01384 [Nannochloris sp. 'desiccata']